MTLNYEAANFWVTVGLWAYGVFSSVRLWVTRKDRATNARVKRLEENLGERLDETERDILIIRREIKNLPSQSQIQRLNENMGLLNAEIHELKGRLTGINRAVDLINEYLINRPAS